MIGNARPPADPVDGPRCCYLDNGKAKMRFKDRASARRFRKENLRGMLWTEYLCPNCSQWHLATRKGERI